MTVEAAQQPRLVVKTPPLQLDVPLALYTTFRIGGPARLLADVANAEQLREAVVWAERHELPYIVLGRGSNVLVGDRGFDGVVVRNARSTAIDLLPGCRIRAESGVGVERLIAVALALGWSGLEHFAGIPSTLGGALWQNLHFLDPDRRRVLFIGDLVESATIVAGGAVERVPGDWFAFGYDESRLRDGEAVLLDATLILSPAAPNAIRDVVRANLAWRAERHPAAAASRSAGCVFRNPAGFSAARAIESAGLKGRRVGGAVVSRRHANFILNVSGATASDVRELFDVVAEEVERNSGVTLEPELAFVGAGFTPTRQDGRVTAAVSQ